MARQHVLTKQEAFRVLNDIHETYFNQDRYIQGKHQMEMLAEKMVSKRPDLAEDAIKIHRLLKQARSGEYGNLAYFSELPVIENFLANAKGTEFEPAIKKITDTIKDLQDELIGKLIDWDKSSKVLFEVKQKTWPEYLTMIEKLDAMPKKAKKGGVPTR